MHCHRLTQSYYTAEFFKETSAKKVTAKNDDDDDDISVAEHVVRAARNACYAKCNSVKVCSEL